MAPIWLSGFLVAVCVTIVQGQKVCPRCNDKYNPDSCTETTFCGVGWNFCELLVHTSDFYSVEYVCQNYADCRNHEIHGCHPTVDEACSYCCEDLETCRIQRDDLFTYVFPTAGPPNTTPITHPPTTTADPGTTFSCPRCTNPYDHTSCATTQACSSSTYDTCELQVHTGDRNRLEYSCQKYGDCNNHATFGCHPEEQDICSYCCLDPVACKIQRDDLFEFVFPPDVVTLAVQTNAATTTTRPVTAKATG